MNLKERRNQLNLTMKEVADYVGVSEATVSRWESGNIANMKRSRVKALSEILRVSPLDILGENPERDNSTSVSDSYILDPDVAEIAKELSERPELKVLLDASRDLTKEDIEAIVRLVRR